MMEFMTTKDKMKDSMKDQLDPTEQEDDSEMAEGGHMRSYPAFEYDAAPCWSRCLSGRRRRRIAFCCTVLCLGVLVLVLLIVRGGTTDEDETPMMTTATTTALDEPLSDQSSASVGTPSTSTGSSGSSSRQEPSTGPQDHQQQQEQPQPEHPIGLTVHLPDTEEAMTPPTTEHKPQATVTTTIIPFPLGTSQCRLTDGTFWTDMLPYDEDEKHPTVNHISPSWLGYTTIGLDSAHNRTFDVVPNHTRLDNNQGVIFNVETVPTALPQHLNSPRLSQNDILEAVQKEAGKFYREPTYPIPANPEVDMEVLSDVNEDNMIFAGGQGFVAAAMLSFAHHLPLALSPDHLWAVIASGFAYHVDQYAEDLRHHFVNHTGQLLIHIQEDTMLQSASPPSQWEDLIFPKFTEQIRHNMNNTQIYDLMVEQTFSTTTPTTHAATRITLMAAVKSYFTYSMTTACGIPQIQLEGSRKDWVSLRSRTERLAQWMMPNHPQGDLWIRDVVLPILDQFLEAYDGTVNYCFWQNMVKFRNTGDRSGDYDYLSGWLPNLFPYLSLGDGSIRPNRFLRHWSHSALGDQRGPDPSQIPIQMSSAPVLWTYLEEEYPLHFHAGFRGVEQLSGADDVSSGGGILRPALGWYITYDPQEEE